MALLWAGFLLIALIDLIPLIRQRDSRTVATFLLLFIPTLVLTGLQAAGVEIPGVMILWWRALRALGLSYGRI